jgi:hypothetical protein
MDLAAQAVTVGQEQQILLQAHLYCMLEEAVEVLLLLAAQMQQVVVLAGLMVMQVQQEQLIVDLAVAVELVIYQQVKTLLAAMAGQAL